MEWFVRKGRRLGRRAAFSCVCTLAVAGLLRGEQSQDLAEISHRARELILQKRFREAIPLCESLVKAMPGNPGLLFNLGLAEQMAGYPERAVPRFEAVLKMEPSNVPALTSLARAELELGRPKAAIIPLKKLIAVQPSNQVGQGMLASALMSAGDLDEAVTQYGKMTAKFPKDPKAWYGLGKAYEAESARLYDRLTKLGAQSPYVAALIGAARLKGRQYHSAFFFFKAAEQGAPELRGVHAALALIYRKAEHPSWAETEERKEDRLPPPDCEAKTPECYFLENQYAAAAKASGPGAGAASLYWSIKAYDELSLEAFAHLSSLPDSMELHALNAQLAHARNEELEAVSEWRAALKLEPGNERLEEELARSLFLARDYQNAMPLIGKLMRSDPRSPDLNFMMGESLLRVEEPGKAVPYLLTALRVNPGMLPADAALGLSLAKLGRDTEAIPHLEKALELDDDGALHYQLSRAYRQAGNTARAAELMTQYQQIQKQTQEEKAELANDVQITPPSVN